MKKSFLFVYFILFFLLFIVSLPSVGFSAITLSFPYMNIQRDQIFAIPLSVTSNDQVGFYSWNLIIEYDPVILSYISMNSNAQLTQNYTYCLANEPTPGKILIAGAVGYNSSTGEDIPTLGTGTLLSLTFSPKTQIPMIKTKSSITITPKQYPENSLLHAICNNGSIEIQQALTISAIEPVTGALTGAITISIHGQGFMTGALSIINSIQGINSTIDPSHTLITTTIPAHTLSQGVLFDIIVTNPDGDFGILKDVCIFNTGINLFGYPLTSPIENKSSYEILSSLDTTSHRITLLKGFDTQNISWKNTYWHSGAPSGTNFTLSYLNGILLYVSGSTPFFSNLSIGDSSDLGMEDQLSLLSAKLINGLNLITFHPQDNILNSRTFITALSQKTGKDITLNHYRSDQASWVTTTKFFGRINNITFPIADGEAYIAYQH